MVEQKVWPKLDKVTLESPALTCVVKNKPYAIAISIKGADGAVLQKIDTTLMSTEDQSILPDRPLVIGPALYGQSRSRRPSRRQAAGRAEAGLLESRLTPSDGIDSGRNFRAPRHSAACGFVRGPAPAGLFVARCLAPAILFDLPCKGRKDASSDPDVGCLPPRGLRRGNA